MFSINRMILTTILCIGLSHGAVAEENPRLKNDFTGNGYNDLVWHDYLSGAIKLWEMNSTTLIEQYDILETSNTNLVVKAFADFNNDGYPDILLHNANSGNVRIWTMDYNDEIVRTGNINVLASSNTNLKIIGAGDFDGDDNVDIAVYNTNTGALRIWLMDGNMTRLDNRVVVSSANTNLTGEAVGDLNADGKPDILLRNNNTGNVRTWLMDGMTRSSNELIANSSNTNLKVRGVLDLDKDGNDDVLWSNRATGKVLMWKMDGVDKNGTNIEIGIVRDLAWDVGAGDGGFDIDAASQKVLLNTETNATLLETDAHYYKLVLNESTLVNVFTTNDNGLDTYGYIYTGSGSLLAEDDDGGADTNFRIIRRLNSGTYYIKVRGYDESEDGNYTLQVEELDIQPVSVEPNSSTEAYLVGGEVDFYEVTIPETGTLTVETESDVDTYGYLYDNNWQLIDENDDDGNDNNFYIEKSVNAGKYYIQVQGYDSEDEGDYTLVLSFSTP